MEGGGERARERDARKTTLSKEGFKDYQLRLLGNLQSCILSTSKSRCALEYCKWESEGVWWWAAGVWGWIFGAGEGGLISLINADTGPV